MNTSEDDGKFLADALLQAPPAILASCLVMLREVGVLSLLQSRARAVVTRSEDEIGLQLSIKTDQLAETTAPGLLVIELVTELNRLLGVDPHDYVVRRDLEDNGSAIIGRVLAGLMAKDSSFKGGNLRDIVAHQMANLTAALGAEVKKGSTDADTIVREVHKYFEDLPLNSRHECESTLVSARSRTTSSVMR